MAAVAVQIPSVVLDNVQVDHLDAERASITSGALAPFNFVTGDTYEITTDAGVVSISINAVDVDDIDEVTAEEAAFILNAGLGALGTAEAQEDGSVVIYSATYGASSSIQVTDTPAVDPMSWGLSAAAGTDPTTQNAAINLYPEPDEEEIDADALISVDVFSSSGTAPNIADIDIYIDGVLAFFNGSFQTGFNGGSSSTSLVDAATRRIVVDASASFDSQALVEARVMCGSLDRTWSFVVQDLTAPSLTDAVAQDLTTIRVTFDEPVAGEDASADNDALNPENWTLAKVSTIAVTAEVTAVTRIDSSTYDLTTDIPLTFGATYTITAGADIEDLRGNAMAGAPSNVVTFTGFNPAVPAGRRFQLWDFIPEDNRRRDTTRHLYKFISVLQEVTNLELHYVDKFADILDPDTAPEDVVDAMLQDLGNPFEFDFDLTDKRRLISVLVPMYQLKGTKPGIISAIQFLLGLTVTVERVADGTWVLGETALGVDTELGSGEQSILYSYQIVSPVALTDEQRQRVRAIATFMQSAQEHLLRIVEPSTPVEEFDIDHVQLGYSALGETFILH